MKLIGKISKEQFEHEFLKGEFYKKEYDEVRLQAEDIIATPDFNNTEHNRLINYLLWVLRKPLLERLPADIIWWEAELEDEDFENILIIRETGWENTFGTNKTMKDVAQAIIDRLGDKGVDLPKIKEIQKNIGSHSFDERLILIGESANAPLTVMEGNHRAVAFQLEKMENGKDNHIPKNILVGISLNIRNCAWWNWI